MTIENNKTNLLLVDDDINFCEVLSRALERRNFNVSTAHNVAQGYEQAKQHLPAYAVVDLRIGLESGLVMVKKLAELDADMRIVVLTGYASIATAVEAIKLGARHYLTKPVEVGDIIEGLHSEAGNPDIEASTKPMSVKRLEWEHLQKVLQAHDGNISAASRALGMHRRTLQRKLQKRPVKQ